jgi:hypothetical protein
MFNSTKTLFNDVHIPLSLSLQTFYCDLIINKNTIYEQTYDIQNDHIHSLAFIL